VSVDEHTIELAGTPVFYRRAPVAGHAEAEPLYLHGVPTSADDWTPFLERTGGIAPDLIGFGRSGKGGHLDYTLAGYADFLDAFLTAVDVTRVELVAHQFTGALLPLLVERNPSLIARIVLIDPVPLLEQLRWPPLVQRWRRPGLGELVMGFTVKPLFARSLRAGGSWSDARIDALWEQFDQGTQRAILRLARDAGRPRLAALGAHLDRLDRPALILWGERDPWLPVDLADRFAARFPSATLERVAGAGHWPWLDDPTVVDRVSRFLEQTDSRR
jgi:pimeloyl-ACP methyl ester carboxylesterase